MKILDDSGLSYFWSKLKAFFAPKAHTHNAFETKHSYTTAANAAKTWYRIANASTQQLDTSKPIHAQFILTAYNTSYAADYYERWFVNAGVFGRTANIAIFGATSIPFSQARILYENTVANIDANDRPALDIYLNYVFPNGTTKIEIEEVYNSGGWTFVADGQLAASTVPSGFENVACGVRNNGVERSTYADYVPYLQRQINNITAAFTLADNNTYRSRTLNCTGTFTITIPSLNSALMWCVIKNKNTSSGVITLHPSTTSVLIDGSNADITLQPMEYVCIHSAGANNYSLIADGRNIGIDKTNSTEDANSLYSVTTGTKIEYYTFSNGGTTLANVPAAVNTTLESRTLRRLSAADWCVEQICHNTSGLYYRRGSNNGWLPWKTFAFIDSDITGNAATASAVAWSGVTGKPTTIAGYGITDAKIANGTITLGSNSITPLTSVPSHNQASNTINAMTGYSKPSSGSAISASDSLNAAVGKLEAKVDAYDDSNYVHKTGAETVAGRKTFTGGVEVENEFFYARTTDSTAGESKDILRAYDKDGHRRMLLRFFPNGVTEGTYSGDTVHSRILSLTETVVDSDASAIWGGSLVLGRDANGNPYCACTGTSASRANASDIITRGYLNGNDSGVVHKTGDESIVGNKTFSTGLSATTISCAAYSRPDDTSFLSIYGYDYSVDTYKGGHVNIYGSNYRAGTSTGATYGGSVRLIATNSSASCEMLLRANGTATWNGQTIQTSSDERLKTPLSAVPDEVLDAWLDVEWGQFQFLGAVAEKGGSARLHAGLIAQAAVRAFAARGLDACRYGILCHELREASEDDPGEDLWTVRYAEALCMEAACMRRENARLKKRVSDLEDRLAALELRLGSE